MILLGLPFGLLGPCDISQASWCLAPLEHSDWLPARRILAWTCWEGCVETAYLGGSLQVESRAMESGDPGMGM